jgi:hypothetical protein
MIQPSRRRARVGLILLATALFATVWLLFNAIRLRSVGIEIVNEGSVAISELDVSYGTSAAGCRAVFRDIAPGKKVLICAEREDLFLYSIEVRRGAVVLQERYPYEVGKWTRYVIGVGDKGLAHKTRVCPW